MSKLNQTSDIVLKILRERPKSRTDDFKLYGYVLNELKVDIKMPLVDFLRNAKEKGMPAFATVTKCRRTLQGVHPELVDEQTAIARNNEQGEYMTYNNKIFGGNK